MTMKRSAVLATVMMTLVYEAPFYHVRANFSRICWELYSIKTFYYYKKRFTLTTKKHVIRIAAKIKLFSAMSKEKAKAVKPNCSMTLSLFWSCHETRSVRKMWKTC
jgi:hypothetical protein